MKIVYCTQCGGHMPEGFSLCPTCMKRAGAGEAEVATAAEILEITNIVNMRETDASRRTAIESILNIKSRLEERPNAEKEKAKAPPPQVNHSPTRPCGKPTHAEDSGN